MTVRYSGRRPIQGTVVIETNGRTAQGRVLNLSVPGCLLETGIRLCVGQAVALTMLLSDGQAMNVGLAVVRGEPRVALPARAGDAEQLRLERRRLLRQDEEQQRRDHGPSTSPADPSETVRFPTPRRPPSSFGSGNLPVELTNI